MMTWALRPHGVRTRGKKKSETPVDVTVPTPVVTSDFIPREQEFQQRFKRKAETETDHLEQEIKWQDGARGPHGLLRILLG